MKILISSHAFAPSIGGIETVGGLLAREFVRAGHEVRVVTQTPSEADEEDCYQTFRKPSPGQLWSAVRWCDIFWHNNLSLRAIWPVLFLQRPVVITHHGSYCRPASGLDLAHRLRHIVVGFTTNVSVSGAVADWFRAKSTVISDPYDAELFRLSADINERSLDLVFLGRLVSEKGVNLLLEAVRELKDQQLFPTLTIIGTGPQACQLQELRDRLELEDQVNFSGVKQGRELVELLNRHKVLVVPSTYAEPFGIVALEGIACGCVIVGSSGGGLTEAIGPCGVTFRNGDVRSLAQTLARILRQPDEQNRLRSGAAQHLARFHAATVARSYLNLFETLL
jgi:glycosyltransferase involved in cell wall biosynthesis